MRTVWKFPIEITDVQEIEIPKGAKIIFVGAQRGFYPCIWAEVDSDNKKEKIPIYVVGTGNPIPKKAVTHIGSFFQESFVWHIYTK